MRNHRPGATALQFFNQPGSITTAAGRHHATGPGRFCPSPGLLRDSHSGLRLDFSAPPSGLDSGSSALRAGLGRAGRRHWAIGPAGTGIGPGAGHRAGLPFRAGRRAGLGRRAGWAASGLYRAPFWLAAAWLRAGPGFWAAIRLPGSNSGSGLDQAFSASVPRWALARVGAAGRARRARGPAAGTARARQLPRHATSRPPPPPPGPGSAAGPPPPGLAHRLQPPVSGWIRWPPAHAGRRPPGHALGRSGAAFRPGQFQFAAQ